jgi:hypothetical protein
MIPMVRPFFPGREAASRLGSMPSALAMAVALKPCDLSANSLALSGCHLCAALHTQADAINIMVTERVSCYKRLIELPAGRADAM